MIRVLPVVLELAVLIYCLIDCIQTDSERVRNLPKPGWLILIVVLPLVGGIAWLIAGRPRRELGRGSFGAPGALQSGPLPRPGVARPRAVAPDDDPEFLARLAKEAEQDRLLDEWEARRRDRGDAPDPDEDDPPPADRHTGQG